MKYIYAEPRTNSYYPLLLLLLTILRSVNMVIKRIGYVMLCYVVKQFYRQQAGLQLYWTENITEMPLWPGLCRGTR